MPFYKYLDVIIDQRVGLLYMMVQGGRVQFPGNY